MMTTLIVLHVIICILLVVTVLLQFGKGAETGAIMGGGASQAVFTSSAKGNFFSRLTTVLAIGFMLNSIALSTLKTKEAKKSLFDNEAPVAAPLNSDSAAAQNASAPSTQTPATSSAPNAAPQAQAKTDTAAAPAQTNKAAPQATTPATQPTNP
jgi:preprotein translocase subunit SecG